MRIAFGLLWTLLLISCQASEKASRSQPDSAQQSGLGRRYSQVTLKEVHHSPGIDIQTYALITDDAEAHRKEAEAIMRVKRDWPLAMQTKDEALFNRILARNFTFREADARFYEREEYIHDRLERQQTVALASYENLVLQFFGEVAVLTYRNIVQSKDASGNAETWRMSWADVFVKEDGDWKIGASHLIDERLEKP